MRQRGGGGGEEVGDGGGDGIGVWENISPLI